MEDLYEIDDECVLDMLMDLDDNLPKENYFNNIDLANSSSIVLEMLEDPQQLQDHQQLQGQQQLQDHQQLQAHQQLQGQQQIQGQQQLQAHQQLQGQQQLLGQQQQQQPEIKLSLTEMDSFVRKGKEGLFNFADKNSLKLQDLT